MECNNNFIGLILSIDKPKKAMSQSKVQAEVVSKKGEKKFGHPQQSPIHNFQKVWVGVVTGEWYMVRIEAPSTP